MIHSMLLGLAATASPSLAQPIKETMYCREIVSGASRSQSIRTCRTKAQWRRWDSCHGSVTRYCTAKQKKEASLTGAESAFPLNEGSRIICRKVKVTGTRLQSVNACLPQREWERMWKDGANSAQKMQEQSTRARDLGVQ